MTDLVAKNATAQLQKLKQEERSIQNRIKGDEARLAVIEAQCKSLEPIASTKAAKPTK